MDNHLRENHDNVYLATVEGPPDFELALKDTLASDVTAVRFVPLMMVEGHHMTNHVMGDEPESWKVQIGLPATNASGMAANPEAMAILLESIEDLISQF